MATLAVGEPYYIDGIKALHKKLYDYFTNAYKIASKVIHLTSSDIEKFDVNNTYRIYLDSSKCKIDSELNGFLVYGKYICRFLPVRLEPAVLFPVRDLLTNKYIGKGLKSLDILGLTLNDEILCFKKITDSRVHYPFYNTSLISDSTQERLEFLKLLDDIGNPFIDFSDIKSLKIINHIPSHLLESVYSLVGTKYYAPFSKSDGDCFCVLYAQLNNPYDENAIKVLRWFPYNRMEAIAKNAELSKYEFLLSRVEENIARTTDRMLRYEGRVDYNDQFLRYNKTSKHRYEEILETKTFFGDIFYELGYISQNQNYELHKFMIENDTQLLFGKIVNNSITILDSIALFRTSEYKLPSCIKALTIC